jgi:uncharacterized protein YqgC (DUF456 family)
MIVLRVLGYIGFYLLLLIGLISIVFTMPGNFIIFGGALIYAIITNFTVIGWKLLLTLGIMATVAELLEYILGVVGAKKLGASKWGVIGALIGAIIGSIVLAPLFLGIGALIGLFVGAFLGAYIVELIRGVPPNEAFRSGLGALSGRVGATFVKLIIAAVMIFFIIRAMI